MAFEWALDTPVTRTFIEMDKRIIQEEVLGVGSDGEPTLIVVDEEAEYPVEVDGVADRVRLLSAGNDRSALQFHIRLVYGRLSDGGGFEPSIRDNGIIIGGPEYAALDANQDGAISEEELLNMSAEILKWDGKLVELTSLPEEGLA